MTPVVLNGQDGTHAPLIKCGCVTHSYPLARTCRLVLKLGPQYDMGALLPRASEGWQLAMYGSQWAVWIKA